MTRSRATVLNVHRISIQKDSQMFTTTLGSADVRHKVGEETNERCGFLCLAIKTARKKIERWVYYGWDITLVPWRVVRLLPSTSSHKPVNVKQQSTGVYSIFIITRTCEHVSHRRWFPVGNRNLRLARTFFIPVITGACNL